ncbi:hypothetical protein V8G54_006437 [Vigna mungo]|uniref:Uncharacterized protein n=1 Tax=Vigna mungo TaxID=3915 RepID=A0AAQ3P003_VIGMU
MRYTPSLYPEPHTTPHCISLLLSPFLQSNQTRFLSTQLIKSNQNPIFFIFLFIYAFITFDIGRHGWIKEPLNIFILRKEENINKNSSPTLRTLQKHLFTQFPSFTKVTKYTILPFF